MKAEGFIARRLRFEGALAAVAIAISFFVVIVAVSVAGGFRSEVRSAVSELFGDVRVSWPDSSDLARVLAVEGVSSAEPVVFRTGIIKAEENIQGITFKGVETGDTLRYQARIPSKLASSLELAEGDSFLAYFIGERVSARRYTVGEIYDAPIDNDESLLVITSFDELRRVGGTDGGSSFSSWADALEVRLEPRFRSREASRRVANGIMLSTSLEASSTADRFSHLFDWLDLVDSNVYAIIVLMALVAGFNMISGLLILLFRNISTIGVLKSLGMTNRSVAGVFLRLSARLVSVGMLAGNALALIFCLVQGSTRFIRLDPSNYFVSFVPVSLDLPLLLAADAAVFAVIMLLLLVPSLFVSKVDPSRTMRVE